VGLTGVAGLRFGVLDTVRFSFTGKGITRAAAGFYKIGTGMILDEWRADASQRANVMSLGAKIKKSGLPNVVSLGFTNPDESRETNGACGGRLLAEVVDYMVARILDHLQVPHQLITPWGPQ